MQEHHVKFEKYKMQDALIQEEEEGQRLDKNKAAAKAASDREKKQRKKVPALDFGCRNFDSQEIIVHCSA